ncbi:hypothetical protein [Ohtaekwangia koreensis]|uniref:Uncharacterized protein n=1 Tax=Ohtaekwangia koreensis TaxID=688867 RepID=A0A1T5LSN1_9BACT|nr:hypothetical protein [Ohtaekwangia koreensis]SKC78983.1 hypothetical protein SAMN05660236_3850 [Ohtaekwangia koreensis]
MMKYLFILLTGCLKGSNSIILPFSPNGNKKDIYHEVRNVVAEKDFSVIYTVSTPYNNVVHKVFSLKDDIWEKIEIRNGVAEGIL